jgi:L-fuconolactonase
MRVDAHQHFWHFDPVRDAWIDDRMRVLQRDFLPADVDGDRRATAIDAIVAVQADQSEAETDFLLSLASRHHEIRGVVGWIDLRAPDLTEQLAVRRANPLLKGFRHIAQAEPDDFLQRPEIIAAVTALGACAYSYDILIHARQLPAADALVSACDGVRFVLDHCAKPPIASGDLTDWRRGIARIARHPNLHCKLSGLVTEADWNHWTPEQITTCLDVVGEAFGADRLLFGSDWPVCLLAGSYARVFDVVDSWAARLTVPERARVFGGTAMAVYRLEH